MAIMFLAIGGGLYGNFIFIPGFPMMITGAVLFVIGLAIAVSLRTCLKPMKEEYDRKHRVNDLIDYAVSAEMAAAAAQSKPFPTLSSEQCSKIEQVAESTYPQGEASVLYAIHNELDQQQLSFIQNLPESANNVNEAATTQQEEATQDDQVEGATDNSPQYNDVVLAPPSYEMAIAETSDTMPVGQSSYVHPTAQPVTSPDTYGNSSVYSVPPYRADEYQYWNVS